MEIKRKIVFKAFDYMHCDDFASYLHKMATKGWHFKEWGIGLIFEKGEPSNTTYSVEVFMEASENDTRPGIKTKEFAEYCEAAGWKLIDAKRKFCIFEKVHDDAVGILTPEERVNNAYKGTVSGFNIVLLVFLGVNVLLRWIAAVLSITDIIVSGANLFAFITWNILFLDWLYHFIYAMRRKQHLLQDIAEGKEVYIGNSEEKKEISIRVISLSVISTLLFACSLAGDMAEFLFAFVAVAILTLIYVNLIAKTRFGTNKYIAVQIVSKVILFISAFALGIGAIIVREMRHSPRQLPLHISEYRECVEKKEWGNREKSFLGSRETYTILVSREHSLSYTIYKVNNAWFLDRIWDEQTWSEKDEATIDVSVEWEAVDAFRNSVGDYYVKYEDVIVVLEEDADVVLAKDQIRIIRDRLDLR